MAGGVSVFAITLFLVDKYSFQVDQSLSSLLLRSFASRALSARFLPKLLNVPQKLQD